MDDGPWPRSDSCEARFNTGPRAASRGGNPGTCELQFLLTAVANRADSLAAVRTPAPGAGGSGFSLTLLLAFLLLPLTSFADVVHPLRIYEIFDTNKQAFHDRFRDHAMRIMAKYEFNSVAMWETKNGARTEFVYLLEWPDEAGRGDPGPDAALDGLLAASLVRLHLSLRVTCPCCDRVDDRNHCRASRPNSDSTCRPLRGANVRPDPRNG